MGSSSDEFRPRGQRWRTGGRYDHVDPTTLQPARWSALPSPALSDVPSPSTATIAMPRRMNAWESQLEETTMARVFMQYRRASMRTQRTAPGSVLHCQCVRSRGRGQIHCAAAPRGGGIRGSSLAPARAPPAPRRGSRRAGPTVRAPSVGGATTRVCLAMSLVGDYGCSSSSSDEDDEGQQTKMSTIHNAYSGQSLTS